MRAHEREHQVIRDAFMAIADQKSHFFFKEIPTTSPWGTKTMLVEETQNIAFVKLEHGSRIHVENYVSGFSLGKFYPQFDAAGELVIQSFMDNVYEALTS